MANLNGTDGSDRLTGSDENDFINGFGGDDILNGGAGHDVIDAGSGVDQVSGGAGDDIFNLSTVSYGYDDSTYDGGTGFDTFDYSVAGSNLFWSWDSSSDTFYVGDNQFRNVERIIGGAGDDLFNFGTVPQEIEIFGNDGNDTLRGGGINVLHGGAGDDNISVVNYDDAYGDDGDDLFTLDGYVDGGIFIDGGTGNDTLQTTFGMTVDLVFGTSGGTEFTSVENVIVSGPSYYTTTALGTDGSNRLTSTSWINGESSTVRFHGRGGNDFLQGAAGNDELSGDGDADTLIGGAGDDTIDGGAGVDTLSFELSETGVDVDLVLGRAVGEGADRLSAIENVRGSDEVDRITGTAGANRIEGLAGEDALFGGGGNDVLDGGDNADRMTGGIGNDRYFVQNGSDRVIERVGEGTDTVSSTISYALGANVEALILTGAANINGSGNALANTITGNAGANLINGGAGADRMIGGRGNDVYVIDDAADVVVEQASTFFGSDSVRSLISHTLAANVEKLTLLGNASIAGTGNGLDNVVAGNGAANVLRGEDGNDMLNGGAGADRMVGGLGNDIYSVDQTGDVIAEAVGQGIDTVNSLISYTLGNNLENLALGGGSALDGQGNMLANSINGNAGANQLNGRIGNDTLRGGGGADRFLFDTALGSTNVDAILDFSARDDSIALSRAIFRAISADGVLSAAAFHVGSAAQAADDRIIHNRETGQLFYDRDGSGAAQAVLFATVTPGITLTNADFIGYT